MREIKFRAWDGEKYNYDGFVIYPNGEIEYPEGGWDLTGYISNELLEQYTGLHDKNGKEIYEGDVLGFYNSHHIYGIIDWDYCGYIFRWDRETASKRGEEYLEIIPTNLNMWEIIGNIQENPWFKV